MKHALLAGTLSLGTMAAFSLLPIAPVEAITFAQRSSDITIKADNVGQDFWVDFNGQVDDQGITSTNVEGLGARANFEVESFTNKQVVFNILLKNISANPITQSFVSLLGFRTSPTISSATSDWGSGITVLNDSISAFGGADVNVCFKEGGNKKNCDSGQGGVELGGEARFKAILNFAHDISSGLYVSEFGIRYQGINGTINGQAVNDFSGTGVGEVPTPAVIPGLIGMGIAALRKKSQEKVDQEVGTTV